MKGYIDGKERNSMRVVHGAELFAEKRCATWLCIDPTITHPVSLADQYLNVVQNYEVVLLEKKQNLVELIRYQLWRRTGKLQM